MSENQELLKHEEAVGVERTAVWKFFYTIIHTLSTLVFLFYVALSLSPKSKLVAGQEGGQPGFLVRGSSFQGVQVCIGELIELM